MYIPVNEPLLNGNEKKYLIECIENGWISSEGKFVNKLEDSFAMRHECKYGIAVSNGTAALEVAVVALGIGVGDEVILPTFTIISCALAIIRAGATPIVVDADSTTWNMDVNLIEEQITPKTKAIMVVHIYGIPSDMRPIMELAKKYGLLVIEDTAELIGQKFDGKSCGSFGDISTFSFYANKHITTGEGGMITTNNLELANKCKKLRNLCFQPELRFVHEELGWNFRLTNLQAAVGLAQLERLDEFIEKKRYIGNYYTNQLQGTIGIQLPLPETSYAKNIYWVYGIVLEPEISFQANYVIKEMHKLGIECRPFFWPMHQQPIFKRMGLFKDVTCQVAERIANKGFYLPSGLTITDDQMQKVCKALKKVLKSKS